MVLLILGISTLWIEKGLKHEFTENLEQLKIKQRIDDEFRSSLLQQQKTSPHVTSTTQSPSTKKSKKTLPPKIIEKPLKPRPAANPKKILFIGEPRVLRDQI